MNSVTEKLALRRGPHTAVGSRTSAAPLASRLSAFAKPAAGSVTILRSRSVADLDLRALRPTIEAPPESYERGFAETRDDSGELKISPLDQGPRLTAHSAPEAAPPVDRMPEVSEPIVQRWPATVTRDLPPVAVDAPVYSRADFPAPPETRAPPTVEKPAEFAAPRASAPAQREVPAKPAAERETSPQTPAPKAMPVSPSPRASVFEAIEAPSQERPLPSPATASRNSIPERTNDERVTPRRIDHSEHAERRPTATVVPVAAKPMGTLRSTARDDAPKSRPPPGASVAALSKLKEIQRASQGETVRIGTVQVVVRPNAAPPPAPAVPIAPAARAPSAPAASAFRNVWLSRRRYE